MLYRAFSSSDFEALHALDLAVLRREDPNFDSLPPREREGRSRTSLAALRFYERSEHSFVAEDEQGALCGAVFAQSVWQGDRPTVLVTRVWLGKGEGDATAAGLLRAVSKSAYDAAIYEVHLPLTPPVAEGAEQEGFHTVARYAVRLLGSRSTSALRPPKREGEN